MRYHLIYECPNIKTLSLSHALLFFTCLLIFEHFVYKKEFSQFPHVLFLFFYWELYVSKIFQKQLNLLQWCMILTIPDYRVLIFKSKMHVSCLSPPWGDFFRWKNKKYTFMYTTIVYKVKKQKIIQYNQPSRIKWSYWMAKSELECTHKYICRY